MATVRYERRRLAIGLDIDLALLVLGLCVTPAIAAVASETLGATQVVHGDEQANTAGALKTLANAHVRQLADVATASVSGGSVAHTTGGPQARTGGSNGACSDVPGTFSSIVLCTGGAECIQGMAVGATLLGGWAAACGLSVAQFGQNMTTAGCPLAFAPPATSDTAMTMLCPAACLDAGIEVQGCAAAPSAPPAPPPPVSCAEESALGWIDAQGYRCLAWDGYSCATGPGYTAAELLDVRCNCPACCALSPCASPPPAAPSSPPRPAMPPMPPLIPGEKFVSTMAETAHCNRHDPTAHIAHAPPASTQRPSARRHTDHG
eukprot:5334172-Prymnesium_polylepis.1